MLRHSAISFEKRHARISQALQKKMHERCNGLYVQQIQAPKLHVHVIPSSICLPQTKLLKHNNNDDDDDAAAASEVLFHAKTQPKQSEPCRFPVTLSSNIHEYILSTAKVAI